MPRIFDCVILESEDQLDLLETRFRELQGIPELTHVIAEAAADYQGNMKKTCFVEDPRFIPWRGRWNHVRVEADELTGDSPKERKDSLRDFLAHGFNGEPLDIIMVSNLDEIPAAGAVRRIIAGDVRLPVSLEMTQDDGEPWRGTVVQVRADTGSFAGLRRHRLEFSGFPGGGTRYAKTEADF